MKEKKKIPLLELIVTDDIENYLHAKQYMQKQFVILHFENK